MKKTKITYRPAKVVEAVFFILLIAASLQLLFGLPMGLSVPTLSVLSFLPIFELPKGSCFETFYRQAWESEAIKRFNTADQNGWRQGLRDLSKYLTMMADGETVVINLAYWGVSPDVLVDNTSYPIDIQQLNADTIVVTVKKYQTKATPVTDDEIFGLAFNKIQLVQESHLIKIEEEKNARAIHSICANANTGATPILLTTGDVVDGRRMLRKADVLTLRNSLNKLKHPRQGRRLVLCNDHINDLLNQDEKFQNQYYNRETGAIYNMFNFELFEFNDAPIINTTAKTKTSYGAVAVAGRDFEASVYFHTQRVVQAKGFTKAYASISSQDALYQRSLLNYRHYDIVVPYKQEGIAAIASAPGS